MSVTSGVEDAFVFGIVESDVTLLVGASVAVVAEFVGEKLELGVVALLLTLVFEMPIEVNVSSFAVEVDTVTVVALTTSELADVWDSVSVVLPVLDAGVVAGIDGVATTVETLVLVVVVTGTELPVSVCVVLATDVSVEVSVFPALVSTSVGTLLVVVILSPLVTEVVTELAVIVSAAFVPEAVVSKVSAPETLDPVILSEAIVVPDPVAGLSVMVVGSDIVVPFVAGSDVTGSTSVVVVCVLDGVVVRDRCTVNIRTKVTTVPETHNL